MDRKGSWKRFVNHRIRSLKDLDAAIERLQTAHERCVESAKRSKLLKGSYRTVCEQLERYRACRAENIGKKNC